MLDVHSGGVLPGTKLEHRGAKYLPFGSTFAREFNEMQDRMTRLFGRPFGETMPVPFGGKESEMLGWSPVVEIAEKDKEYVLKAELPGIAAADVKVDFEDGLLSISGEKKVEREENEEPRFHVWERSYGSFRRAFTFPNDVIADDISAKFTDGVLTIHVPKAAEKAPRSHRIEIR